MMVICYDAFVVSPTRYAIQILFEFTFPLIRNKLLFSAHAYFSFYVHVLLLCVLWVVPLQSSFLCGVHAIQR